MDEMMRKRNPDEKAFIERMLSLADHVSVESAHKSTLEMARLMSYYKCAMMTLEAKFNVLNEEYYIETGRSPISSIKTRIKTPPSIIGKLERRGLPMTTASIEENIKDVAGIRVICFFPEDIRTIAKALLHQDDILLLEEKDYISAPKENGYRSLHLIVAAPVFISNEKKMMTVEIQLRTIAMDFWASLEHQLRYKKNAVFTEDMAEELYCCAELSAALDRRMDALRKSVR